MIPIHQTILADPSRGDGHDADGRPGNCYQAAIASVLDLALDEVPHFATFVDDWVQRSERWFADRGLIRSFYTDTALGQLREAASAGRLWVVPGTDVHGHLVERIVGALGAGPSPRGNFRHVVVLDDRLNEIHDPHPSGAGLDLVDEVELIFEVQP